MRILQNVDVQGHSSAHFAHYTIMLEDNVCHSSAQQAKHIDSIFQRTNRKRI